MQHGVLHLLVLLGLLCGGAYGAGELFTEDFDTRTLGDLHNQNAWLADPPTNALVQSDQAFGGSQAAEVSTNTTLWRTFSDTTATNVWVDFYTQVSWQDVSTPPSLEQGDAGGFSVGSDGVVHVRSNTVWLATSTVIPENSWRRFTVNIDYATSNWALYVASDVPNALSTPVATGLQFDPSSTNDYLTRFAFDN